MSVMRELRVRATAGCWLMLLLLMLCAAGPAGAADRIISLAPNLTELAFAAGAGESMVGTVEFSDYPAAARRITRVGDAFRLDYERVVALRPTVILAWEPGTPPAVIERLRALRLNVVIIRTYRLADVGEGVRAIGRIAGTQTVADQAATGFERDIAFLRHEYSGRTPVRVFLQINDRPLFTVNGRQIMSEVVELCGGRNVFGSLSDLAPQIGVEAVIAADPDAIVSTGDSAADGLAQWRSWSQLRAVAADNLFVLPPDGLARPTTRLADGARSMCGALETARARLHAAGTADSVRIQRLPQSPAGTDAS